MLGLRGITVSLGSREILRGFDLDVAEGETVAVMGPSGSGKTTLLRVICGLLPASAGSVLIDGRDVTRAPPHERRVGLLPQEDALYPHRPLRASIETPLRRLGVAVGDRKRRVDDLIAMTRLENAAERRPGNVSGGERRRASIARALAADPLVLLLDEPLSSLDEPLRDDLRASLRSWIAERGLATLLVTHDPRDADAIAQRIVSVPDGRR